MTVWLLETGLYADARVSGVYVTAEAAMAARPEGNWVKDGEGSWVNGLDWDEFAMVNEWEVEE